jgi:hypothetical protein
VKRLAALLLLVLSLAGCGGPLDRAAPPSPDRLQGAELLYEPAGCGMCPLSHRPPVYRFFADGRVQVVAATGLSAVSRRITSAQVRELERRVRAAGLDAGDSRRYYPKGTSDLGEAVLQTRVGGRLTTRHYAELDGYHLIGFGRWLSALVAAPTT